MKTKFNFKTVSLFSNFKLFAFYLLFVAGVLQSCQEQEKIVAPVTSETPESGGISQDILKQFLASQLDAPVSSVEYYEADQLFTIDGDMVVSRKNAEEHYTDSRDARTNQRQAAWLLTDEAARDIKVYISPGIDNNWRAAVRQAIPAWNALNDTRVNFREVPVVMLADIIVTGKYEVPKTGSRKWIASQEFPNFYGKVGGGMTINTYYEPENVLSSSRKKYAITHELGHAIGLTHTDKVAEGIADFQICGTPALDAYSIMNHVVSDWTGFSSYDIFAAQILYPQHIWKFLPGTATDVGAGMGTAKSLWVIGKTPVAGGYSIHNFNYATKKWTQVNGGAMRIAVDNNNVPWIVNNTGKIYKRLSDGSWKEYPGLAYDIAVGGNGAVYIVSRKPVLGGFAISYWKNNSWNDVAGRGGVRVAVTSQGIPWIADNFGQVLKLSAQGFEVLTGNARDVAAEKDGSIYAIGTKAVAGGYAIRKWQGNCWIQLAGGGVAISAHGAGEGPVVLDNLGLIREWN